MGAMGSSAVVVSGWAGSDAAWVAGLEGKGVGIAPFRPANCGFDVAWSDVMVEKFAGAPVKGVTARSAAGVVPGEFVVSKTGIEGSLVYAHSAALRDELEAAGAAALVVDLAPGRSVERLAKERGFNTAESRQAAQVAGFESRADKAFTPLAELEARWDRELAAKGWDRETIMRSLGIAARVVAS